MRSDRVRTDPTVTGAVAGLVVERSGTELDRDLNQQRWERVTRLYPEMIL
jgi:hypothetical protein